MKVVTFGEIMLRLAPKGYLRFFQSPEFEATFGGGEANVAVSLANFGVDAAFLTRLPDNDIGRSAERELKKYGVDVSGIAFGGDRMGIYFLEKGAAQRPSKVVYDRKYSSVSTAAEEDFDFDKEMKGADWFHFTGITPALGGKLPELAAAACKAAKKAGAKVSCDLNYRKNLWTTEQAGACMGGLMQYVDLLIANEEDAEKVFGIKGEKTSVSKGELDKDEYISVAKKLTGRFGFETVAITLRRSISASDNIWGGMLYNNEGTFFSKDYNVHIVDRVGGGDSFAAGLIYAQLSGMDPQNSIGFAAAASALKHSVEGDFNLISLKEVETLAGGDGSGRVQR